MSVNGISFLDLVTPHVELEESSPRFFQKVLATAGFIGGPNGRGIRKGVRNVLRRRPLQSRWAAAPMLCVSHHGGGVKPGDVVVTVPHTFIATTEAISQAGALPEFVDIDERTYNMDPEKLREYLETQCETDRVRQAHQPPQRPAGHRRRARSSLRADGRHGRDPRPRRAIPSHRH